MVTAPDAWVPPADDPAAWGRAVGLSRRTFRRIDRASKVLWGSMAAIPLVVSAAITTLRLVS